MARTLRLFRGDGSGATALEFALVAPIFFALVFSTFEAGWMMTKATMLDRALDMTVRLMRVGASDAPKTQDQIKRKICENTLVITDCVNAMMVELVEIKTAADFPSSNAVCVNRGSSIRPVVAFTPGQRSQVMFVRACVVSDPLTPLIGLALHLAKDALGGYSIVSTSAFMNEPSA